MKTDNKPLMLLFNNDINPVIVDVIIVSCLSRLHKDNFITIINKTAL